MGIPGGKIQRGESSETALRREIREETGLEIEDIRFVLSQDAIEPIQFFRPEHFILLNYTAVACSNHVILNEEAEEFVWLEPARALGCDLNHPTRFLLEALADRS